MEENLFSGPKKSEAWSALSSDMPILLPTNFPNMTHFLGRGYVAPRECFGKNDKYYSDLLDLAPGRLPLLSPPVSSEVIEFVQQESQRTARPVLVELDAVDFADTQVPALDEGGNPIQAPSDTVGILALAPPMVVPVSRIEQIHFLSDADLAEFNRLQFGNVREVSADLISVSPSLRDGTGLGAEVLQSWLSGLDESDGPDSQEFTDVNKVGGAAALMAHVDPGLTEEILLLLEDNRPRDGRIPPWMEFLNPSKAVDTSSDHLEDDLAFSAVSSTLRTQFPDTLRPRKILEEISEVLLQSEKLSSKERESLREGIDRIDSILANETPFEGVRNDNYPALQGLMFFLIKQEPRPLLEWSPSDTKASPEAHLTSAAYCGLLHGHSGLPLDFRSERFDKHIAGWAASELSLLHVGRAEGMKREVDTERSDREPGLVQQLSDMLLSENLQSDGLAREAALEICREEELTDCVETVVYAPDRSSAETYVTKEGGLNRKLKMAWRIPGTAEVKHELNVKHFRSYVKDGEIDQKTMRDVADRYLS